MSINEGISVLSVIDLYFLQGAISNYFLTYLSVRDVHGPFDFMFHRVWNAVSTSVPVEHVNLKQLSLGRTQ